MSPISGDNVGAAAMLNRGRLITRQLAPILVLAGLLATFAVVIPGILTPRTLLTVADESSALLVLALGQTAVVLMGRIDLSLGTLTSFATVLLALLLPVIGGLAVPGVIAATAAAGLLQGWIHARMQLPSFVVTLGGMAVWAGLAIMFSGARTIGIDAGFEWVGWAFGDVLGFPRAFIIALLVAGFLAAILKLTAVGRWHASIGHSERAAVLSGVPVTATVVASFAFAGACAGIAAVLLVARAFSAGPGFGDALLLPALAAVVVGGTAITGGFGGAGRTIVGVLIVTVLRIGLAIMWIPPAVVEIVYGAILAVAVAATIDRSKVRLIA